MPSYFSVAAGASAPETLVQEVVRHLDDLSGGAATSSALPEVDEGITFQLPSELR